jgi:hypothetical protein
MKNYTVNYKDNNGNMIQVPTIAESEDMAIAIANVRIFDICNKGAMLPKYKFYSVE